jgi:putative ABC transport system ATP-binding protein
MITVQRLSRSYRGPAGDVPVLREVSFTIGAGEFVAVMGASGSGKSTLLNILGLLDHHDHGEYHLAGERIARPDEALAARLRNRLLGFVFQSFHLLPSFTALENVALPLGYQGVPRGERLRRAQEMLTRLGMEHRAHHRPNELSGGQRQRVAIARALVTRPQVILADEPTGNLDSTTSREIMACFTELHRAGATIVLVTHEDDIAAHATRTIRLRDGEVVS